MAVTAILAIVLSSGCGGEADGSGTLQDVSVNPEAGYPGVEIEVTLTISPDDDADDGDYSWEVDFGDGNRRSGEGTDGVATHSYDATNPDGYEIVIDALHDGAVADTMTLDYPVYDPVDLSAGSVLVEPANVLVRDGEQVTISFDIRNETASPVITPFSVYGYLTEDPEVGREDIEELAEVGSQQFEAGDDEEIVLPGGAQRNVSITDQVPDVDSGEYYAVVVIDPHEELGFDDPEATLAVSSNDISVENLDEDLPNLSVQNLQMMPDRAFPELNQLTRGFTLANLGGADAFSIVYHTYLHDEPVFDKQQAQLVDTGELSHLLAHGEQVIGPDDITLSEPIVPSGEEDDEIWVIVEVYSDDGDIEEATTDNNVLISSEPIVISDEPVDGPDIAVDDFSVSPDSTYLDGILEVDTTISNEGTEPVSSFFCGVYMDEDPVIDAEAGAQVGTLNVVSLEPNEQIHFQEEINIPAVHDAGTYYFFIVCDPAGAINQPHRGNSQAIDTDPVEVTDEADIDLYVYDVELPEQAEDGETITAEATICVDGSNPTGTTLAEVYVDGGNDVDFDAEPYDDFELANIDPGDCVEESFEVTARCDNFVDEMSVGLFVDAEQTLPELDTSNNRGVSTQPVSLQGQYCQCQEDDFDSNQNSSAPHGIGPGQYEGSICTPGECSYFGVTLFEGQSLLVDTFHDSQRGLLETTMYASDGTTQLDKDDSPNHQQVGVFNNPSSNVQYVFGVCGLDDAMNYYDFDIDVVDQPEGVDLRPRNLELPPVETFSVGADIGIDLRIYNIGQQATGSFDVDLVLTDDPELGVGTDIMLGTRTIDESINGGSHLDVTLDAPLASLVDDGDYHIAVILDPDDDLEDETPDENIVFTPEFTIETNCYDAFSPNHSFSDAEPVFFGADNYVSNDSGSFSNLVACADQNDYFQICAADATSIDASVQFDAADNDIDIFLFDETFETVDTSAQTGVGLEEVGVDYVDGDQCYYLRVDLISLIDDVEKSYELDVDVSEVAPDLQCDPTFEPNDSFQQASSLWAALNYDQKLERCPSDDVDYYTVKLSPDSTIDLSATLDPENQPGTLRLQLYRPDGVPAETVETAPGVPTAEITDYTPPTTGTFYVRVSITGDEHKATYTLDADGLPGVDLAAEHLAIGPGNYEEGDKIRFDFDLINYGGEAVSSVNYRVYLGADSAHDPAEDQSLGNFDIDLIDGNSSRTIEGQVNVPSGVDTGSKHVHVVVDPDDEHDDVNLDNNIASVPIEIVESIDDDNDV